MPILSGWKRELSSTHFSWMQMIRKALFALILAAAILPFGSPAAADVPLRPGDDIQLRVSSLPSLDITAQVNLDGTLNFAWMGSFNASERTVKDLELEIQASAVGKIVKQYNNDGVLFIIQLEGDEIYLIRGPYQPVIVSGDVARPGAVAFTPGITVRDAIAISGGTQSGLLDGLLITDPAQILRWQGDYGTAALQHAEGSVDLWRLNAEINQDPDAPVLEPTSVRVSSEVLDNMISEQRQFINIRQKTEAGERIFFSEALKQAESRIEILKLQQIQLTAALNSDEADETRIQDLVNRGLAPSARLSEVRRNTVQSATRLLDLEEILASAELEITRQHRENSKYEEQRLIDLLNEKKAAQSVIRISAIRMDVLSQYLSGQTTDFGSDDLVALFNYDATIFRKTASSVTTVYGDETTVLLPGDTLEVSLQSQQSLNQLSE